MRNLRAVCERQKTWPKPSTNPNRQSTLSLKKILLTVLAGASLLLVSGATATYKHIVYPGVSHAFDEASDWVKHHNPSIHAQAVEEQYAFLASALGR